MMARALEENGAKVYIIGRRLESLGKAAKLAVRISQPLHAVNTERESNTATSSLSKVMPPRKETLPESLIQSPRQMDSSTSSSPTLESQDLL